MNNTGVPKHKLYMEEYNPAWARTGQQLADQLKGVMKKAVDIRHVGSTAVRGMMAKPLIDIAVATVDVRDIEEYIDELEAMDIHFAGEVFPGQREFYIDDPVNGNRMAHIHVVPYDSRPWRVYVGLVDYLNANESARESYINLKRAFVTFYEDQPDHYGPAKEYFMEDLKNRALEWKEAQNGTLS